MNADLPPKLLCRPMRAGEETMVCAMVLRIFARHVAPDFRDEGIREFRDYVEPEKLARRARGDHTVLVAEDAEQIVGMIEIRHPGHVSLLFVEQPGRGIARALFQRALARCRAHTPTLREITVHSSRYAVPVYERLGFRSEGPEREENGIRFIPMALHVEGEAV